MLLIIILTLKTWKKYSSSKPKEEDEDEQDHPQGIENKGDKFSNDLDFYAWYRHKKRRIHWILKDDEINITPYSRTRSKPFMKNISATEWNTMSDSQVLSKSMPEGGFEKLITWKNIKLNRDGKLLTNEKEMF